MVRFINDDRKVDGLTGQPLVVIGAGLPRAATSSMQAALEQLGFTPCMHMANIIPHPAREQLLLNAIRERDVAARHKLLHQLTDGHASICDLPVVFFTPDFMDMYPDAAVVLNGRPDGAVWARSAYDSLGFVFTWRFKWACLLWRNTRLWYALNMEILDWCGRRFGVRDIFTKEMYDKYYASVREEAAKRGRKVLEFKAEDGWDPLCKFLGRPVPDVPFPKLNEKRTFTIVKCILVGQGLAAWAALGGSIWAAWKFGPSLIERMASGLF